MKKALAILALTMACSAIIPAATYASSDEKGMWFDVHSSEQPDAGIGLAKHTNGPLWTGVWLDSLGTDEASASVNAIYIVPEKFMFMEFYGGAGVDYTLKTADLGGHIIAGTNFWVFFSEAEYRLVDRGTELRGGIRLKF